MSARMPPRRGTTRSPARRRAPAPSVSRSRAALPREAFPRRVARAGRGHERSELAEPEWRHPSVDRFVLAGADLIRLVPDADVAAALRHALVESDPRGPV